MNTRHSTNWWGRRRDAVRRLGWDWTSIFIALLVILVVGLAIFFTGYLTSRPPPWDIATKNFQYDLIIGDAKCTAIVFTDPWLKDASGIICTGDQHMSENQFYVAVWTDTVPTLGNTKIHIGLFISQADAESFLVRCAKEAGVLDVTTYADVKAKEEEFLGKSLARRIFTFTADVYPLAIGEEAKTE